MTSRVDVEIDIVAEEGWTIVPATGKTELWRGLRVRFRYAGVRRWSRFLVVASPGQSLVDLVTAAVHVVAIDDTRPGTAVRANTETVAA